MAVRDRVTLPEGFRWIRNEDGRMQFKSLDPNMDRYDLNDYYEWSQEPNSLVIVREIENKVAGVLYLTVGHYITIEMLARNKLPPYVGVGGELVRVVERYVAPQLGIMEVRLEALPHVVQYYDEILGYSEYDAEYNHPEWGRLTPKRKFLAAVP